MRFLKHRECINGENHTTRGDCRAVVPVYIFGTRTAQVGRHTADFEVLFQKQVRVFDHDIKTREINEFRGKKTREIHCFRAFVYHDHQTERIFEMASETKGNQHCGRENYMGMFYNTQSALVKTFQTKKTM